MSPRQRVQAGAENALSNNIQPRITRDSVTTKPSSTVPLAPASNGHGSTPTADQSLSSRSEVQKLNSVVPKLSVIVPGRKHRRKPKAIPASTPLGNTQPKVSQKSSATTPSPCLPLTSAQQGVASTTMANPTFSGTSKAWKPTENVPATVTRTFLEKSKALKPNQTVSNVSESPIVQSRKKQKNTEWKAAWMTKDAGELVQTILSSSLEAATATVSSELGFEDLCSYNWQDNGSIVVPGGPPKWMPPSLPITLPPDTGHQFVDQNAFRMPKFPFEPAFQALSIMKPEAKLDEIDIIANRNSLRKLLDFAAARRRDPWRMDLHMVKNTLFISRKEMNARTMVHGAGNSGYGHNFEKAFTKPEQGLDNSSSHHRVIRYRLGDLECAVRFEVDAYYEDPDGSGSMDLTQQSLDQIITTMAQLEVKEPQSNVIKKGGTRVTIKGTPINPSKLAEIKTRKNLNINEALPQLWFGRTPYLLTGTHNQGVFGSINCSHVYLKFKSWEREQQENLRKLVDLLTKLKQFVQEIDGGAAILVYKKGGPLQIFKMKNTTNVLPQDMITKYWSSGVDVEIKTG